jgi:hypothetical protein
MPPIFVTALDGIAALVASMMNKIRYVVWRDANVQHGGKQDRPKAMPEAPPATTSLTNGASDSAQRMKRVRLLFVPLAAERDPSLSRLGNNPP